MSDYIPIIPRVVDVPNIPCNIQENGGQIKPLLRQGIFNGEPCEYDENVKKSLKKYMGRNSVKMGVLLTAAIFMFIYFFIQLTDENMKNSTFFAVLTYILLAAAIIVITVFILNIYFAGVTVRLAKKGKVKCFRYKLHGRLRYVLDPCDGGDLYYADLGDFCVDISAYDDLGSTVTGIVVNIKGTEHFYLLV